MLRDAVITFERGPHGEIFPPPLVAGMTMEEALEELMRASEELGHPITDMPSRGRSREGMEWLAVVHAHQHRLRSCLAGEMMDNPDVLDLHQAVMVEGEPMSLRPLGQEDLVFAGFVPVLQRIEGDLWRIGIGEEQGKALEITAAPEDVVRRAQEIYVLWSDADDEAWGKQVSQALKRLPRSVAHQYWAWQLHQQGQWDRGGGYGLVDPAGHGTRLLDLPGGRRILRTDRLRAVRIVDALARKAGIEASWPQVGEVVAWLEQEGVPLPVPGEEEIQRLGVARVAWKKKSGGAPSASLTVGEKGYALLVSRKEVTLHPIRKGRPDRKKRLAATAMEAPLREWLGNAEGRGALAMWAVWEGKLLEDAS